MDLRLESALRGAVRFAAPFPQRCPASLLHASSLPRCCLPVAAHVCTDARARRLLAPVPTTLGPTKEQALLTEGLTPCSLTRTTRYERSFPPPMNTRAQRMRMRAPHAHERSSCHHSWLGGFIL